MTTNTNYTPSAQNPRRLMRSKSNRVIAGVCGGFARYFQIDVVVVRVLLVALLLAGILPGVIFYLLSWMIIPIEN